MSADLIALIHEETELKKHHRAYLHVHEELELSLIHIYVEVGAKLPASGVLYGNAVPSKGCPLYRLSLIHILVLF